MVTYLEGQNSGLCWTRRLGDRLANRHYATGGHESYPPDDLADFKVLVGVGELRGDCATMLVVDILGGRPTGRCSAPVT
jgi:hypothetical protein